MKKYKCVLEPIFVEAENEDEALDRVVDWLNDYGFESELEIIEIYEKEWKEWLAKEFEDNGVEYNADNN